MLVRETWRRGWRRLRSAPLVSWRLRGGTPEALTVTPLDLHPTDPAIAVSFYEGRYLLAGRLVETGAESPFAYARDGSGPPPGAATGDGRGSDRPTGEWFDALHGFGWLRHLDAAQTDLTHVQGKALVRDWMRQWGGQVDSPAWRTDIVASRLIAWITHAPLLVTRDTDMGFYTDLLRMLGRHMRFLQRNGRHAREGHPRLLCAIALAYGTLCLKGWERQQAGTLRDLDRELARHVSGTAPLLRKPQGVLETLALLLPLRHGLEQQGFDPSAPLNQAIATLFATLHRLRHDDGSLARFNGMGETDEALLEAILQRAPAAADGEPATRPQAGGLHRLAAGDTVIVLDAGAPNGQCADGWVAAGTLAFELSSAGQRVVVNCGAPAFDRKRLLPFAQATAAHSTVTVNHESSSLFASQTWAGRWLSAAIVQPPRTVTADRSTDDDGNAVLEASHDGYLRRHGLVHHRSLALSADGNTLQGTDRLVAKGRGGGPTVPAHLRFHLPPGARTSALASGHAILIAGTGSDSWTFSCVDAPMSIEESIQFATAPDGHPRKSSQIVVTIDDGRDAEVRWLLERKSGRTDRTRSGKPRRTGAERTTHTGDLLDGLTGTDDGAIGANGAATPGDAD